MACEFLSITKSNYIKVLLASLGKVRLKMTNQKILPYNLYNDTIRHKIEFLINNRPSYLLNVSGHVYGNFGAGDIELSEFKTNKYGVASWTYPTNSIPNKNINTSEYWAVAYYEGQNITSNIVRDNYIKYFDVVFFQSFIYDAGTCDPLSYVETSGYVSASGWIETSGYVPPSGFVEIEETIVPSWIEYPNYTETSIGSVDFWGNLINQSAFENQTELVYNEASGTLMVTDDSVNDVSLVSVSGSFRYTVGLYLDTDGNYSHGIIAEGNGNIYALKWWYKSGLRIIYLNLNGGAYLFSVPNVTEPRIDLQLEYDYPNTTLTARYDIGPSGDWTTGYVESPADLGPQPAIGMDFGASAGGEAGYTHFLIEASGGLPYSGEPYTDYEEWFYDDFEPDPWATGVWLDLSPSIASGIGYITEDSPATGDQISSPISGNFVLDVRLWGTPPSSHGIRMQSDNGYLFAGADGQEPLSIMYDNANGAFGEVSSGTLTSNSYHWVRLKATYDVSGHYESFWSDGYEYPTSWMYITDDVTGEIADWYMPLGSGLGYASTPVYMSVTNESASGWGISSLRLSTTDDSLFLSSGIYVLSGGYYEYSGYYTYSGYYQYSGYYTSGLYVDFDRSLFYIYDASGLNRTDYTIIDRMAGYSGIPTS